MENRDIAPLYILYGTSACHLCELAEELLVALQAARGDFAYEKVDISESDDLMTRYGVRIPVLSAPGGGELGWPFTATQLQRFVAGKAAD